MVFHPTPEAVLYQRLSYSELGGLDWPAVVHISGETCENLSPHVRETLRSEYHRSGAVLVRGLSWSTRERADISDLAEALFGIVVPGTPFFDYSGGNSPRSSVSRNIFLSTSIDKGFIIRQHHEATYLPQSPRILMFLCKQAAAQGGESPITRAERIYGGLSSDVKQWVNNNSLLLRRWIPPDTEILEPLQRRFGGLPKCRGSVFPGMSPADIDTFLRRDSHTVETRWDDWGALWYSIQRPVVCHPETAQGPVLYNHLINLAQDSAERSSTLDALFESFSDVLSPVGYSKEVVESLLVDFTNIGGLVTVNREPIPDYVLHDMRQVIARNTIALSLEENDILLLDNQRTMHGRLAYEGDRQMWVSMAGAYQC